MKKIVLLAALTAASLSISACGKKAEEAPVVVDTATAAAMDATPAASEDAEGASTEAKMKSAGNCKTGRAGGCGPSPCPAFLRPGSRLAEFPARGQIAANRRTVGVELGRHERF